MFASSEGAGFGVYIALYLGGLVFCLWLYSKAPKRANMSPKAAGARSGILFCAFFPCAVIHIFSALFFYGQYKFHMRGMMSEGDLSKRFANSSFGTGGTATSAKPPAAPGENPFGSSGGAPKSPTKPSDNPFA